MEATYLTLKSELLNGDEHAAIIEMLQSSDAESSSDDDLSPSSKGQLLLEPSTGDSSVWKAIANLINFIEGVSFLALPYALKQGGIGALVAFIVIPIIPWYMGTLLIDCLYDKDSEGKRIRARSTFNDLGAELLPRYGGCILSIVVSIEVFFVSVTYLVLFGSVMHHALPLVPISERQWFCIAGILVLPTTFLKSLSQIAWLSVVSILALVVVVVSVVWYGVENTHEWNFNSLLVWNSEGAINSLPVIMYSYAAAVIFPFIEGSMVKKEKFGKALASAYIVSALTKLLFSLLAFLSFGSNTNEAVINNLPPGPIHMAVSSFFAFNCVLSYVLNLFLILETTHNSVITHLRDDKIPSFFTYAIVRITLVLMTVAVAVSIPSFYAIVMFAGSTMGPFLETIFPCVLHLKLRYKQLRLYQIVFHILLLCFGIAVTILGVGSSFKTVIELYQI